MNILALNWQDLTNPLSGGAEVHLEELLRRLVSMGHQVTLFCSNYTAGLPEETIEGVKIIRRGSRYDFNFIAPFHLRKLVKKERFDILLEDINKIPFYTPLYLNIPSLIVIPHLFATTVFQEINFILGSYIYCAERPMATIYKRRKFNVISESTAADLVERGIPEKNITVVHCGIDDSMYFHDASIEKYETPTIIYLGRLKKYKCIQHLISSLKQIRQKIPNTRLMIVGAGDYLEELKLHAKKLGLSECVEFTGFVTAEDKVERLRRSHVCVCPSTKEGWGLTNIEANACGTVVVAANVAGLRDSVRDNESGLLYPHGDIDSLSAKIEQIITSREERERLETGALNWAKNFNWDKAAAAFMENIKHTIGQKSKPNPQASSK